MIPGIPALLAFLAIELLIDGDNHTIDAAQGQESLRARAYVVATEHGTALVLR